MAGRSAGIWSVCLFDGRNNNKHRYLNLNIAVDKDKPFAGRSVAVLSSFSRNWKGPVVVDEGFSDSYDYLWSFAKVHASTHNVPITIVIG